MLRKPFGGQPYRRSHCPRTFAILQISNSVLFGLGNSYSYPTLGSSTDTIKILPSHCTFELKVLYLNVALTKSKLLDELLSELK